MKPEDIKNHITFARQRVGKTTIIGGRLKVESSRNVLTELLDKSPYIGTEVEKQIAEEIMHSIYTDQRMRFREVLMDIMLMSRDPSLVEKHEELLRLASML